MNAYKWAMDVDYKMVLDLFYKDSNEAKGETSFEEFEIDDIENFVEEAVRTTDELHSYLETNTMPEKCGDVWLRKLTPKGHLVATRCTTYCSVSDACPYFSDSMAKIDTVNKLAEGW